MRSRNPKKLDDGSSDFDVDIAKPVLPEYRVHDTKIDVYRDDLTLVKASDGLGWTSLHAMVVRLAQTGKEPYQHIHQATSDLWLATSLTDVDFARTMDGVHRRAKLPADLTSVTASGSECTDLLYCPVTALHVFVKAQIINEVADELAGGNKDFSVVSAYCVDDPVLRAILQAIRQALFEPPHTAELKIDYLGRALAAQVLQLHSMKTHQTVRPLAANGLGKRHLKLVSDYIEAHLSAQIPVGDLAAITDLSPTHFIRQFKAATNFTPHQYVLHARIREAKGMLAHSNLDLSAIALACGFADQAHFSSTFKRHVGVSPLRYRREAQ
jgi:AraC family transcriptional regulator